MTFLMGCVLAIASLLASDNYVQPTTNQSLAAQATSSWLLAGKATHYGACRRCAAAGPELRAALGDYLGKRVTVTSGGRSVTVTLVTSCACGDRDGSPTLIDLSLDSFAALAPLGTGVIDVEVTPARSIPLPATDTAP